LRATAAWPGRGDGEAGLARRSDLGDNLATFLAARLSGSFDNLSCKDYGLTDPVTLIAEYLAPYVQAGCTEFNLIPQSPDHDLAIAGTAAVRKLLRGA
jgi:hypothetical protein